MNTNIINTLSSILLAALLLVSCNNATDPWLTEQANNLKKSLPVTISEDVLQLDNVDALPGNTLQFEFRMLDTEKLNNVKEFEITSKEEAIATLKKNPQLNEFRKKKVTIIYIYKNKRSEYLSKIKVKPGEY